MYKNKYDDVKKNIFAKGVIPDGYFGELAEVWFAYDKVSGKTLVISKHGYFPFHTPYAVDKREALWLLIHHPSSTAKKVHKAEGRE